MSKNEYGEPLDKNGYSESAFPTGQCYYADDKYTACYGSDLCRHEVFHADMGGTIREQSKRYGAWVNLCPVHHGMVHSYPQFYKPLQREAQRRVMERYGWDTEKFIDHFGKNYL